MQRGGLFESHNSCIHLTDVRFLAVSVLELLELRLACINLCTRCSIVTTFECPGYIVLPGLGFLTDDVIRHYSLTLIFQCLIERQ